MKIRNAQKDDYESLMELFNLFVGKDRYGRYDADAFITTLNNPQNYIFVAEDKGELVGFITMSVRDVVRYPRPIAEVDELFVREDYRKAGVGRMLMDELEKKARELECFRIFIGSFYERETAHKFYEALGYQNKGYQFVKYLSDL